MKKFTKKFGKRATRPARVNFYLKAPVPYNCAELDRDHMPAEVALALLLEPRARLTNTMRKACLAARETHYVSTLEPKSHGQRLTARASRANWGQLVQWTGRVQKRLRGIEHAEEKIKGMGEEQAKLRQVLMLREGLLENALEVFKAEILTREAFATAKKPAKKEAPPF